VSPALFSLSLSSHSPYTLPSYVSCKSCICHSYAPSASRTVLRDENPGGMGVFLPFWNAPFASRIFYKSIGGQATVSLRPFDFKLSTVNLFTPNSFPLNLFANPHPLTPVASIFYKTSGGGGPHVSNLPPLFSLCLLSSNSFPFIYLRNTNSVTPFFLYSCKLVGGVGVLRSTSSLRSGSMEIGAEQPRVAVTQSATACLNDTSPLKTL
jgi:hypothetical protein